MGFRQGQEVTCRTKVIIFQGFITAIGRSLDGKTFYVVEQPNGYWFKASEADLTPVECKHNVDFHFRHDIGIDPGWYCNLGCGFVLSFDPSIFPDGIAYSIRPQEGKKIELKVSKY